MGFWTNAKWAASKAFDHIEGRPAQKQYKLHPDSAYLGTKYYPQETQALPIPSRRPDSHDSSTFTSTSPLSSFPSLGTSPPAIEPGSQTGMVRPHVHIGREAVQTPMRLPEAKYTVLTQVDLVDDGKIDEMVGRDKNLYWVIKGAVVLILRERSEAEAVTTPVRTVRKKDVVTKVEFGVEDGVRNPLRSPSVEDFLADTFDADQYVPIDTLPPNPLDKVPGASQPLNPLDAIPWSELVIVFRRDTKQLLVRKLDGKLYPVIWKVREIQSRLREVDDEPRVVGGIKFTRVEGEIDAEDYMNIDFL